MTETKTDPQATTAETPDSVWTYRGYRMKTGEFNTAMVHFYRGELGRSNVWRMRLDSTTNWAVVTAGAVLTFAFGSTSETSHVVILLGFLFVWLFLMIEARRYRYYELWALRVRLLETDFFAAMLNPPFAPHHEWATRLVDTILTPEFPISLLEALGRRLRRHYIWLFLILGLAWGAKVMLQTGPDYAYQGFLDQAAIGLIPGQGVVLGVAVFFLTILLISVLTVGLQDSPGEVLPRHKVLDLPSDLLQNLASAASHVLGDDLSIWHRRKHLTIVITDKPKEVSQQLLAFLKRGVTALEGTGMYTGQPRSVLLCAVAPTEIRRFKELVYSLDDKAFVVVNPTEEIWGGGFQELQPRWRQARKKKT